MFRSHYSPILADFGSSGVKLVQTTVGDLPTVSAAAFVAFSDDLRSRPVEDRFEFLARELPEALRENHFRGNRLVLAPFSQHMLVQHVGVPSADAERAESVIKLQIAIGLGCDPDALVVRTNEVCETTRDGSAKIEHIAFAMSRDDVMRYVELARRTKLNVVGVHGEISALVHAFDHVNRRAEDENITTMYVDLGYGGTKVAICHGAKLVFAKSLTIAGRTIDARLSETRRCTLSEARAARLAEGIKPIRIGAPAFAAAAPAAAPEGVAQERTEPLRVERATANATKLAAFLEGHEKVEWVRHPSLASHPDRAVANRILGGKWGGMLSFKPRAAAGVDPLDAMRAFADNIDLFGVGVSLGEVDTLVYPMPKRGGIFRISVGIEGSDDIIREFDRALAHVK